MARILAACLAWAERVLTAAIIPVESFGWRKLGEWQPGVGRPVEYGRWASSEAERERFYVHNRELMGLAVRLRAIRAKVGNYPPHGGQDA